MRTATATASTATSPWPPRNGNNPGATRASCTGAHGWWPLSTGRPATTPCSMTPSGRSSPPAQPDATPSRHARPPPPCAASVQRWSASDSCLVVAVGRRAARRRAAISAGHATSATPPAPRNKKRRISVTRPEAAEQDAQLDALISRSLALRVDEPGGGRVARRRGPPPPPRRRGVVGAAGDVHRDPRVRRLPVRPGRPVRHRCPGPGHVERGGRPRRSRPDAARPRHRRVRRPVPTGARRVADLLGAAGQRRRPLRRPADRRLRRPGHEHAHRLRGRDRPAACSDRSPHRSSPPTSPSTPTGRWSPSPADPTGTSPSTASPTAELVGTVPGLSRPDGVDLDPRHGCARVRPDGRVYLGSIAGPIRVIDPASMQVVADVRRAAAVVEQPDHRHRLAGCWSPPATKRPSPSTPPPAPYVGRRPRARQQRLQHDRHRRTLRAASTAATRSAAGRGQQIGRVGRLEERDLATGQPTGVVLDPQQGTVGDLAVSADERSWSPSATTPRSSPAGGSTGPDR